MFIFIYIYIYITDWKKLRHLLLRKVLQNMYYGLEEITPLVTDVKSYRYTLPTGRNYAVSYWRKIVQYIQLTGGNYIYILLSASGCYN